MQEALERHFANWELDRSPAADLEFRDSATGFTWIIEAKGGDVSEEKSDFQIALGRLLAQMSLGPQVSYGVAMPDIDAFASRRQEIPQWVREKLNLYWFVIDATGEVQAIPPHVSPL